MIIVLSYQLFFVFFCVFFLKLILCLLSHFPRRTSTMTDTQQPHRQDSQLTLIDGIFLPKLSNIPDMTSHIRSIKQLDLKAR